MLADLDFDACCERLEPLLAAWSDIVVPQAFESPLNTSYKPAYAWMHAYERQLRKRVEAIMKTHFGTSERSQRPSRTRSFTATGEIRGFRSACRAPSASPAWRLQSTTRDPASIPPPSLPKQNGGGPISASPATGFARSQEREYLPGTATAGERSPSSSSFRPPDDTRSPSLMPNVPPPRADHLGELQFIRRHAWELRRRPTNPREGVRVARSYLRQAQSSS
jgi:hypothetical protein